MSTSTNSGFYSLKAELPNGKTYDFEQLKGKVVLIVNVASKWCVPLAPWIGHRVSASDPLLTDPLLYSGFTPQYKGLQALYTKHKDEGLEILGFPCNQVCCLVYFLPRRNSDLVQRI